MGPEVAGLRFQLNLTTLGTSLLDTTGQQVAKTLQELAPTKWLETTQPTHYHLSLNYLYCVSQNYTAQVRDALSAVEWSPLTVHFTHVCCATDGGWSLGLCVRPQDQVALTVLSRQVREVLNRHGVPLPAYTDAWQPYYHLTLGWVNATYNMTLALMQPPVDVPITLTYFLFEGTPYYAQTASKNILAEILVLVGAFLLLGLAVTHYCCTITRRRRLATPFVQLT